MPKQQINRSIELQNIKSNIINHTVIHSESSSTTLGAWNRIGTLWRRWWFLAGHSAVSRVYEASKSWKVHGFSSATEGRESDLLKDGRSKRYPERGSLGTVCGGWYFSIMRE